MTGFGDPLHELLNEAFKGPEQWASFEAAVADSGLPNINRWVDHWAKRLRVQVARRASIPPHYANGAIERPLAEVRRMLERRKWCFRNRARMDLLLDLVRLRLRGLDRETVYAVRIRDHLVATGGRPTRRYRQIYDHRQGDKRVSSLRPAAA